MKHLWLIALLVPSTAQAAREPVLKSITAPHSYYWRELYLPQLTSGPSSAAFSPDGREVVYSQAGSLWRQSLDGDVAHEVTHGPGYDYQPDCSRDGRFVVFTRHHGDALELVALDLASGKEHPLTQTGAVNVEPRFSPDGTRLAFVSTRRAGNFEVWTARFQDGRLSEEQLLLPPRESAVKRYYYAATDHSINPSWTPDGKALLLVTNREVAWGTGDLWRVSLAKPEKAEPLLSEETSWAMRPEMSPDGRRILYSSYHGRQWHQLWMTNTAGESPMPLTFGDFDRRNARWSPEGRRVLHISNENGNTELWVQQVVGGGRRKVEAKERRWRRPMASLEIKIQDEAGRALPSRLVVTAGDGRHHGPETHWLHADDLFDRATQTHEDHYFHCPGVCRVTVPMGSVTVRAQHGLEYLPVETTVEVGPNPQPLMLMLAANHLPERFGRWTSLDQHIHMNYGGHYRHTPETLAAQAAAEDLDVIYNLIVNKEQRVNDIHHFTPEPQNFDGVTVFQSQEFHTSFWGHLGLLHLGDHFLTPDFAAYRHSGFASPFPHNGVIADLAQAQGALVGYVHPYDWEIVPAKEKSLTHQFPADVALGKVDYFELVSFSDPRSNEKVWHRLLNLGYRVPAGAGTDAMANYASLRGPVGLNRLMIPEVPHTAAALTEAVRQGRGFVTNGPLLGLKVDGKASGDLLELRTKATLRFEAAVSSLVPLDSIELLVNGKVAASFKAENGRDGDWSGEIELAESGWIALRAQSASSHRFIADLYPYGHTNPIWVEVGGKCPHSPDDARYFVAWLDRVTTEAAARDDWNTEAEKKETLEYLEAARQVFESPTRAPSGEVYNPGKRCP